MATRLRKGRHQRGSRTHGWGTSGQHRGSGMRGGFGRAGRYRHKRSKLIRTKEFFRMRYAGKKGFTPVSRKCPRSMALNLWQLSQVVDKLVAEKKLQLVNQRVVVDLGELGFKKLLGGGSITQAVQVKVDQCSANAIEKIKEAGGEVILPMSTK